MGLIHSIPPMKRKNFFRIAVPTILFWLAGMITFCSYRRTEISQRRRAEGPEMRVLLFREKGLFSVGILGPYRVIDPQTLKVLSHGESGRNFLVEPCPEGIQLDSARFSGKALLLKSKKESFTLDGREYSGKLYIQKEGEALLAANWLPLEEYIAGVLEGEMPLWASGEALKSQAVAARTYAFYHMESKKALPFFLRSDTFAQVYRGKGSPKASRWAAQTLGEILTYQGRPFESLYHSTCGGGTADASKVFASPQILPLGGRFCPFCEAGESPHMQWSCEFSPKELSEKLVGKEGGATDIRPYETDRFGRWLTVRVSSPFGERIMKGEAFRTALGTGRVKSTLITSIISTDDSVLFQGQGWGHGAGLCQWGAMEMGRRGFSYKKILSYYYPDSEIEKIY